MYDVVIIGGGINGCGIARDAAGRGLSVLLAEKADLASGTSSASTKLIHGGLRYLEHYAFRLVHEALREREVLLAMAPHIIRPLRFVLPHHRGLRPAWLIRLGLLLYDRLGGRSSALPASQAVDLTRTPAGKPLQPGYTYGFEYSDCSVDDARLVVLNAMDAAARGADIRVRTEVVSARRAEGRWLVELCDTVPGRTEVIEGRVLVNATGAWIAESSARRIEARPVANVRLVKGSHIVVPRLFDHDSAYILQQPDRRIVFAIPYEQDFTLIGTTDVDCAGDLDSVVISGEEIAYLCGAVNRYFTTAIAPADVVWSYAGVRSLHDDGRASAQDTTRDFVLELDGKPGEAPLLSIVGGKITTYRRVAEQALGTLMPVLARQAGPPWTRGAPLPGGDFAYQDRDRLASCLAAAVPVLNAATARRLARTYGTVAQAMFADAKRAEDLGVHFGAGLYEREVRHLIDNEWARTADDILWRRTKLGLYLTQDERHRLEDWLRRCGALGPSSAS
jgi:glycerol-3-phosphate dehydrogenase